MNNRNNDRQQQEMQQQVTNLKQMKLFLKIASFNSTKDGKLTKTIQEIPNLSMWMSQFPPDSLFMTQVIRTYRMRNSWFSDQTSRHFCRSAATVLRSCCTSLSRLFLSCALEGLRSTEGPCIRQLNNELAKGINS